MHTLSLHDALPISLRAGAKEFKFVVEVLVAGLGANFVFQIMDRAGGFNGIDGSAAGTDQVVTMLVREDEGKIGSTFMQTETTNNAGVVQAVEQAVDGGFVALGGEGAGFLKPGEGHRAVGLEQGAQENLQGLGTSKSTGPAAVNKLSEIGAHGRQLNPIELGTAVFSLVSYSCRAEKKPMNIHVKALLPVFGALVMGILPGEAVELRLKWQPGKRYVFDNTADSSMKMPFPGQGLIETKGRMVMRVHNDVSPHEKGLKVSQAFDSVRMRQEMQGLVMEFDSSDPSKGGGLLGTVLKPLTETRFAAIYDKTGKVVGTEGLDEVQGADQLGMGKEELEAMARQSSEFLPGRDVKPGDTWNSEVDLPMGELGGKVTIDYTLKLENIVEQEGRKVARVSLSGKMKVAEVPEEGEILKTEVKEADRKSVV